MAIDFSDATTFAEEMDDNDALNLAIWALNTVLHPEGSQEQFAWDVVDHFGEEAIERLVALRDLADDGGGKIR